MEYEALYSYFRTLFASDSDRLDQLAKAANTDESDGMHIMFSFVVIPFVIGLLHENNTEKLTRAFGFFEEMASSDDTAITEVLKFTVIENLMSNGKTIYEQAVKFMGPETLKSLEAVSRYLDVADNK